MANRRPSDELILKLFVKNKILEMRPSKSESEKAALALQIKSIIEANKIIDVTYSNNRGKKIAEKEFDKIASEQTKFLTRLLDNLYPEDLEQFISDDNNILLIKYFDLRDGFKQTNPQDNKSECLKNANKTIVLFARKKRYLTQLSKYVKWL